MSTTPAALSEQIAFLEMLRYVCQGPQIEMMDAVLATLRSRPGEGMLNQAAAFCDGLAKYVRHHSTCESFKGYLLPIALACETNCTCGASDALKGAALALPAAVAPANKCDHMNCAINTYTGAAFGTCSRCGDDVQFPKLPAPVETARAEEGRYTYVTSTNEIYDRKRKQVVAFGRSDGQGAAELIAALSAPSLEDARDAARYRYFRSRWERIAWQHGGVEDYDVVNDDETLATDCNWGDERIGRALDAAIDAARADTGGR